MYIEHSIINITFLFNIFSNYNADIVYGKKGFMETPFKLGKNIYWSGSNNQSDFLSYHSQKVKINSKSCKEKIIYGMKFGICFNIFRQGFYLGETQEVQANLTQFSNSFLLTSKRNITLKSVPLTELPNGIQWDELYQPPNYLDLLPLGSNSTIPIKTSVPNKFKSILSKIIWYIPITFAIQANIRINEESRSGLKVTHHYIERHFLSYPFNQTNLLFGWKLDHRKLPEGDDDAAVITRNEILRLFPNQKISIA